MSDQGKKLKLYNYWRSSASWRVRIILEKLGLPYDYIAVDLTKNEQKSTSFLEINPSGLVPALVLENGTVITQSLAIIEYLIKSYIIEDIFLPAGGALECSRITQIAMIVACDTHPLQNLRELLLIDDLEGRKNRAAQVINRSLSLVENLIGDSDIHYCVGNKMSLADVCLVPQVYNARRWGIDVNSMYPKIARIDAYLSRCPEFLAAHPDQQPDAKK